MEGVGAADRIGSTTSHDPGDPLGHVSRNMSNRLGPVVSELVEEDIQRCFAATWPGPDQPAGVMVDNHNQIPVSPLIGDLIDSDPSQPLEAIHPRCNIIIDSGDDRSDRPPRHPEQVTGRTLRRTDR